MNPRPPAQPNQTEDVASDPRPPAPEEPIADDPVETSGIQSFPASDPPQWWAGPSD